MAFKDFKIVIPARYASSRFPGKPLAMLAGQPMLWHAWQRAIETACDEIVVTTDDERIRDVATEFGADVAMTSKDCESGTDRIAEVAQQRGWSDETIIVNLQGDEPLTPPKVIEQVAYNLSQHQQAGIATLCSAITRRGDFHNANIVKVLFDHEGLALYFSRAPIPWPRDCEDGLPVNAFRHIGLYAYRAEFLKHWLTMGHSSLENTEKLEQLRAMQSGVRIHVAEACRVPPHGVDTPEQLAELEQHMSEL